MSIVAASSATCTGLWNGSTTMDVPIRARFVRAATAPMNEKMPDRIPCREKWCSPSQMSSIPILSANSACSSAFASVSSPVMLSCHRIVSNMPNLMVASPMSPSLPVIIGEHHIPNRRGLPFPAAALWRVSVAPAQYNASAPQSCTLYPTSHNHRSAPGPCPSTTDPYSRSPPT